MGDRILDKAREPILTMTDIRKPKELKIAESKYNVLLMIKDHSFSPDIDSFSQRDHSSAPGAKSQARRRRPKYPDGFPSIDAF